MSNFLKILCGIVCLFFSSTALHAQDSGWTVNPHDYQYDMTVYGCLVIDGATVTNYDNYEIGAFVGDECRGLAEVKSKGGYTWLYLRVRSNVASGETVKFKIYDKAAGKAFHVVETVSFASTGQVGMPSSPTTLTLRRYTLGDVNDDGKINITDVTSVLTLMAGGTDANLIIEAADVNEDGKINISDVTSILTIMASK